MGRAELVTLLLMLAENVDAPKSEAPLEFDADALSNMTLSEDRCTAKSTSTESRAVAINGAELGTLEWQFTIDRDTVGDEGLHLGVTSNPPPSDGCVLMCPRCDCGCLCFVEQHGSYASCRGVGCPRVCSVYSSGWHYIKASTGMVYSNGGERVSLFKIRPGDNVRFLMDMDNGTLSIALNDDPYALAVDGLKGELFPAVFSKKNLTEVTIKSAEDTGIASAIPAKVITALCQFVCELLYLTTSDDSATPSKDAVTLAQVQESRRMLLTEKALKQLFSLASSGDDDTMSSVLSVVLNALSEPNIVREMRVSGEPVRLSTVFMQMRDKHMLQYFNSVRHVLLPDVLLDLMLLSTSRVEAERLCALEILASACCTGVPENRGTLLDNNLFRQVTKWLASASAQERNFGLQVLLAVVADDEEIINKLIASSGSVKAVFGALRRAMGTEDIGLELASAAVKALSSNPRFIASMFVKDVAGLQILLSAVHVAGGSGGGKKKLEFDKSSSYGSPSFEDDNKVASTGSGYVRTTTSCDKGKLTAYFELVKDVDGDQGTCFGACTTSPGTSYSSSGWFSYRAYNGVCAPVEVAWWACADADVLFVWFRAQARCTATVPLLARMRRFRPAAS